VTKGETNIASWLRQCNSCVSSVNAVSWCLLLGSWGECTPQTGAVIECFPTLLVSF
jgi:hypothetical protein